MALSRSMSRSSLSLLGGMALGLLSACSLVNAPDEIDPGSGGGGTGGATTTSTGTGMGGNAGCDGPEDCTSLTTECQMGACEGGSCVAQPLAAGTMCGAAPTSDCDAADACDGSGNCVDAKAGDGTFCDDCPAGPGSCALCLAGACEDCTSRAQVKSFRTPLSTAGWTLTGDWRIYSETPPPAQGVPFSTCNDGIDNDTDGLTDFPEDPGCADADDPSEFQPAQCNNGSDDDADGLIDLADPDCTAAGDDTEVGPIRFDHPVLGTDGNRAHPYGRGTEAEVSSATTPPTLIPATLDFLSWHVDEGYNFDLKAVQVSLDGVNFQQIVACMVNVDTPVFCPPYFGNRPPGMWDFVSLPVPAEFQNQVGYVRFLYDTTDACCSGERGWYIDALNFAQDCACTDNTSCGYLDGTCATGECDTLSGECTVAPQALGSSCDFAGVDSACSASACDAFGFCNPGILPFEGDDCSSCAKGDPLCLGCGGGQCVSCPDIQTFTQLDSSQWTFTGDWSQFNGCLSPNSIETNLTPCFPGDPNFDLFSPGFAPVLGNNGSRTGAFPYVAGASEIEAGTFRTGVTVIPAQLTFRSWHQDRGGNDTFALFDKKTIRVSTNGGTTFQTVLSCEGNMTVPFCQPWTPENMNRALDDWDDISIDMPANLVGQEAIFEFTYDTVNTGEGWERGWYIDDLNIATCQITNTYPDSP